MAWGQELGLQWGLGAPGSSLAFLLTLFHPKLLEPLSNNCQCLSNTWPLQCLWFPSTHAAWDSYKGGLLAVTYICVQCLFSFIA